MEQRQVCEVSYQVATYSGSETVYCDCNDDNDCIIARAKEQLRRKIGGSLPYGYESFKIVSREDYFGD